MHDSKLEEQENNKKTMSNNKININTTPCGVYIVNYKGDENESFVIIGRHEDGSRWIASSGWKDGSENFTQDMLDGIDKIELLHKNDPWEELNN